MRPSHWLYTIPLRLRSLFRRDAVERELDDELRDHVEHKAADYRSSGLSDDQARRAALRDLGGLEFRKEQCRDTRRVNLIDTFLRDFRHAARGLHRSPGFSVIAILILTLGIGANVAIFSMVNALLLHPYNFSDLDRLVRVWEDRGVDESFDFRLISPADARDLGASVTVFADLATFAYAELNLSISGNAEPVRASRVSANFFAVLPATPAMGRAFIANDQQPGADDVVILSHALWQRQFAGDPAVIGKTLRLNGRIYTVVGVMPSRFAFPTAMQLWIPLALTPAEWNNRSTRSLNAIARLKPGVTRAQALASLESFARRLQRQFPETNANRRMTFLELRKELYLYTVPLFLLLQAAAIVVLLLGCANLANLFFARMIGRQKEIAVRAALGAGPVRMALLFISETLLLSLIAGVFAVGVSFWTVNLLRTSISPGWTMWVPGWDAIHVDRAVLFFTLALTVLVGILFGVATVWHAARFDLNGTLKDAGRGGLSHAKTRVRSALVIAQVAFALVLLVCAGLSAQGFTRLAEAYQGFDPANILRTEIVLPKEAYTDRTRIASFFGQFLRETRALPGVVSASLIVNPPASNVDNETTPFTIEGRQNPLQAETPSSELLTASSDYFETLRIPLVSGRAISETDTAAAPRVVVISQAMAAHFWPGGDPLGHRIKLGTSDSTEPWLAIVGVVANVRHNWWNPVARSVVYVPFDQAPSRGMTLLLRGAADPLSYAPAVRAIIRRLDPEVGVPSLHTFEHEIEDSIAIVRILGVLMGIFGIVALALASIGVYGVLSEAVAQRTREIGIRISLGADTSQVRRLILKQALKLALVGLLIGVPISFSVNRIMSSTLFGVIALNPVLIFALAVALLAVAFAAAYLPARQAMRLDPIRALRYE